MAGQVKLCFAFLLVLHVSLVSCRHDYYHYFSKYVTGESSPESSPSSTTGESSPKSSPSSTTGISTSKSTDISVPGLLYSEIVISPKNNSYSSSNNDAYERYPTKTVIQSSYNSDDDDFRTLLMIRYGLIVGGIIVAGLVACCCVGLFCLCCCKNKELQGHIVSTNIPNQPTASMLQSQIPQAVAMQHFPPETQTPQNPPLYDTQPIQQQAQYPSTEHLLYQNQMQPIGYQQYQQPLTPRGYSNTETVRTPYPTKY